jgi:tol-pal system protein YbgF
MAMQTQRSISKNRVLNIIFFTFSVQCMAYGQTVVDLQPSNASSSVKQGNSQLFQQLQLLQDELMRMKGKIEEQEYELRKLKQQRLDDYIDLDKRVSVLSNHAQSTKSAAAAVPSQANNSGNPNQTVAKATATANSAGGGDKKAYQDAFQLVKGVKYDQAKAAFQRFLKDYPVSGYVPNAHYWLGELYILEAEPVQASIQFNLVIKKYPSHGKYPEALYKMAIVNYDLNKQDKAKQQLDALVNSTPAVSEVTLRKAREFLQKHYP